MLPDDQFCYGNQLIFITASKQYIVFKSLVQSGVNIENSKMEEKNFFGSYTACFFVGGVNTKSVTLTTDAFC